MASKTAVISSDSGGLSEVNINQKTGFLSAVGDVNDMANKAIYLLSDEQLLRTFKTQAYQHALSFDLPSILPQYEELYQQISSSKIIR